MSEQDKEMSPTPHLIIQFVPSHANTPHVNLTWSVRLMLSTTRRGTETMRFNFHACRHNRECV